MGLVGKGLGKILGALFGAAAVVGTAAAVKGVSDNNKAKKINMEAKEIENDAIASYDKALSYTNQRLQILGEKKKYAVDSIMNFVDLIETIQDRPTISDYSLANFNLPSINVEEIKILSNNLRIAISASAGVAFGALIGFAAFGASYLVAAPAVAAGGFVLCAKGSRIKKEALQNKQKAIELREEIKKITFYYYNVARCADILVSSFNKINSLHNRYMTRVSKILVEKKNWHLFTESEIKCVNNCIELTGLLAEMCKTRIVIQGKNEYAQDRINENGMFSLQKSMDKVLDKIGAY